MIPVIPGLPANAMVLWVRHGETAANRDGVLLGRNDPDLTERGRAQVRQLGAALAAMLHEVDGVQIISSPLKRALTTAAIVGEAVAGAAGSLAAVRVDDRIVELGYGHYEGRRLDELPEDVVRRWRTDPDFAPPAGESLRSVGLRVGALCSEWSTSGAPIHIAVSHVSPIKAAACWALGVDDLVTWNMHVSLASITRIGHRAGRGFLAGFNDTSHLQVPAG